MQIFGLNLYKFIFAISIVGFQQLNLAFFSYLIIFLLSFKTIIVKLKKKYFLISFLIVLFAFVFLLMKGFPLILSLDLLRFYFGPLLFGLLLYRTSKTQRIYFIIAFIFWCLLEVNFIFFTGNPPFYLMNYFNENSGGMSIVSRAQIGNNFFSLIRITGPTLNSSITGVFAAIILNLAIFDKKYLLEGINNSKTIIRRNLFYFTIICSAIILSLSFSGSAIFCFLLLFLWKSKKYILNSLSKFLEFKISKYTLWVILILLIIFLTQFWLYLKNPIASRVTSVYINLIINNKLDYIYKYFDSINIFLFGGYFDQNNIGAYWGGDKQLISFCYTFGTIFMAPLILIAINLSKKLKIYSLILIISSIHYGSFFFLTGQILYGYILVSSKYTIEKKISI